MYIRRLISGSRVFAKRASSWKIKPTGAEEGKRSFCLACNKLLSDLCKPGGPAYNDANCHRRPCMARQKRRPLNRFSAGRRSKPMNDWGLARDLKCDVKDPGSKSVAVTRIA